MSDAEAVLAKLLQQMQALEPATPPSSVDPLPQYDAGDAACLEAIEKTLESPEMQKTLKDEIMTLGTAAEDVEIAFRNVARGLVKIVTAAEREQLQDFIKLARFSEVWDTYHKAVHFTILDTRLVTMICRNMLSSYGNHAA